jgi:hypothetical protein
MVESCIGAHLFNSSFGTNISVTYWRERNHEVDFVLQRARRLVAIEVKSGGRRESLPGMEAFARQFKPKRQLLVGGQGIAGAGVLFDDEPIAAGFLGGGDDAFEIQDPAAYRINAFAAGKINALRKGIGGHFAAQGPQPFNDLVRGVQNIAGPFVRGATVHAGICQDAVELLVGDRSKTARLDGGVANPAEPGQGFGDAGRVLKRVTAGIELGGDLGQFHGRRSLDAFGRSGSISIAPTRESWPRGETLLGSSSHAF